MTLNKYIWGLTVIGLISIFPALAEDNTPSVALKLVSAKLANQAVTAALQECSQRGYQVAVALVGREGNLIALLRDPLAGPHTVDISRGKAYASATFRVPTAEVEQMSESAGLRFAAGVVIVRGGLPIDIGGIFYGGIGVSGATQVADEECARAGIEAITDALEFAE